MNRFYKRLEFLLFLPLCLFIFSHPSNAETREDVLNNTNIPKGIQISKYLERGLRSNNSASILRSKEGTDVVFLTEDKKNQMGTIYSAPFFKMDLTKNQYASMWLYFGNKGANTGEGIAFVMHNDVRGTSAASASGGQTLGVYGDQTRNPEKSAIQRSFAIEFDSFKNANNSNYLDDDKYVENNHVAASYPSLNASYSYYSQWSENVNKLLHDKYSAMMNFSEDDSGSYFGNGKWHHFSFQYYAEKKEFRYTFDKNIGRLDMPLKVEEVLKGEGSNPYEVNWGFTGTTGKQSGVNAVIFEDVSGIIKGKVTQTVVKKNLDGSTGQNVVDGQVHPNNLLRYQINVNYETGNRPWSNLRITSRSEGKQHLEIDKQSLRVILPDGRDYKIDGDKCFDSEGNLLVDLPNVSLKKRDQPLQLSYDVKVKDVQTLSPVSDVVTVTGTGGIEESKKLDYSVAPQQYAINFGEVTDIPNSMITGSILGLDNGEMASLTLDNALLSSNVIIQAPAAINNETNDFSYELKDQLFLVAGQELRGKLVVGKKQIFGTTTVKDRTPPTADGKDVWVEKNGTISSPQHVVRDVKDTNPQVKEADFRYQIDPPLSEIDVSMIGKHPLKISVSDPSGNESKKIASVLHVINEKNWIDSLDVITVKSQELVGLTSNEKTNVIINKAKANAWSINEYHDKVNVSDRITVKDIDRITEQPNEIETEFLVSDLGVKKKVKVIVEDAPLLLELPDFPSIQAQIMNKNRTYMLQKETKLHIADERVAAKGWRLHVSVDAFTVIRGDVKATKYMALEINEGSAQDYTLTSEGSKEIDLSKANDALYFVLHVGKQASNYVRQKDQYQTVVGWTLVPENSHTFSAKSALPQKVSKK